MPVAPRNRLNTAFPVRLMYVLPTIYPRKVENSIYKDKLEFNSVITVYGICEKFL